MSYRVVQDQSGHKPSAGGRPNDWRGFSLIEMLVVSAIIALLASLALPGLSRVKVKARQTSCLNHVRQLHLAWLMYAQDHDRLAENYYFDAAGRINTNAWIRGSMDDHPAYGQVDQGVKDSTNLHAIITGKLFPYNHSTAIYRCPSDRSMTGPTPRIRSYSINGWMGGRPLAGQDQFRVFQRESDVASPSRALVFIDEHEKSINDGWFAVDMVGTRGLLDAPAARHGQRFTVSFVDGHTESWPLTDPRSLAWSQLPIPVSPANADWERIRSVASSPIAAQ
jgi:prepilin-type N-terminal cleavage/methylation domain-containing protein/prepilin-type processing-associated H-X9-DG protein